MQKIIRSAMIRDSGKIVGYLASIKFIRLFNVKFRVIMPIKILVQGENNFRIEIKAVGDVSIPFNCFNLITKPKY